MRVKTTKLGPFKGINNISDPMSLGTKFFTLANNVDITDAKTTRTRGGYRRLRTGSYKSVFSSLNEDATYAATDTEIVRFHDDDDLSEIVISTLVGTGEVRFMEINKEVYYSNGEDSGIITRDNDVYPWSWEYPYTPIVEQFSGSGEMDGGEFQVCVTYIMEGGRESGPSPSFEGYAKQGDSIVVSGFSMPSGVQSILVYVKPPKSTVFQLLGEVIGSTVSWLGNSNDLMEDLVSEISMPVPSDPIDFKLWNGQVACMQYDSESDTTYVWFSEPLIYHLFKADNYIALKGKGSELAAHDSGLFIKMKKSMHVYNGEIIKQIASFGGPPGDSVIADDDGSVLIWTDKGYCGLTPFVRLMDKQVSVSKSGYATGALIEKNGEKRIVALLQSVETPYNIRDN